jgi:ankyrin repeat protein
MQYKNGVTALMLAADNGHDKCVQLLIDSGADVNIQSNVGSTALQMAKNRHHNNCVQILQPLTKQINQCRLQ